MKNHFRRDSCIVFIVSFFLFFGGTQNRPLSTPDEGRYMEIPREMAVTGSLITPRLNGVKYFEKPPFFYWIQASIIKVFGVKEWSGRLLPALAGALGVFFTFFLAFHLFNRRTALLSALILSTSSLYFIMSHIIILDGLFSSLVYGCFTFFIIGIQAPPGPKRKKMALLTATFLALSVLTKGIVAVALFGIVLLIWFSIHRKTIKLLPLYWVSALLLFLAVIMPWHILVQLKNPEFFDFYIIKEHFMRFTTKTHNRYQPFYFFIPVLVFGLFPWCGNLLTLMIRSVTIRNFIKSTDRVNLSYLLVWFLAIFIFFSLSSSKLITYILPIMAPLSVLMAYGINRIGDLKLSFKPEIIAYCLFFTAVIIFYYLKKEDIPSEDLALYTHKIQALIFLCWASVLLPLPLYYLKGAKVVFGALLVLTLSQYSVMIWAARSGDSSSVKTTYDYIDQNLGKDIKYISYHHYHQDLPVYTQNLVPIVGGLGELEFGHTQENHATKLSEENFWKRWFSDEKICAITWKQGGYDLFKKSLKNHMHIRDKKYLRSSHQIPFEIRLKRKVPAFCNISLLEKIN